jgi:hypothetical protein
MWLGVGCTLVVVGLALFFVGFLSLMIVRAVRQSEAKILSDLKRCQLDPIREELDDEELNEEFLAFLDDFYASNLLDPKRKRLSWLKGLSAWIVAAAGIAILAYGVVLIGSWLAA